MKNITFAFCLFLGVSINAQQTGEDKLGAWYMYFGTNKISEKWSIHSEAQFRFYETTSNFNQLLLRTGLNYHINPNAIATLGYGFIKTDASFGEFPNEINLNEHRIFQQFILRNRLGTVLFEHRYRLEQRFITEDDPARDPADTRSTAHRIRYRLQLTLPLTNSIFLNFYDEIFLNLQEEVFGQNRLYAALGMHITGNSSVQIGYLKNHFRTVNLDRLQIGIFFNPDLRGIFSRNNGTSQN
jgi:hypothetical protein